MNDYYWDIVNDDKYKSVSAYWVIKCQKCNKLIGYGYANCSEESTFVDRALCKDCFRTTKKTRRIDY